MASFPPFEILPSVSRAIFRLAMGRVQFNKENLGKVFVTDEGERFSVFRDMVYRPGQIDSAKRPAVFVVTFKFARFSFEKNRKLSRIPIPLILGHRGFIEKVWTVNEKNGFWRGIYQWETEEDAKQYSQSFVLSRMANRAIPDSISMKIIPDQRLAEYLKLI